MTFGIYAYVWTWKTHGEIKSHSGIGVGGPLGFIIYLVVPLVTVFLLPIIGTIVWFVKVQGQLNDYWCGCGAIS